MLQEKALAEVRNLETDVWHFVEGEGKCLFIFLEEKEM